MINRPIGGEKAVQRQQTGITSGLRWMSVNLKGTQAITVFTIYLLV